MEIDLMYILIIGGLVISIVIAAFLLGRSLKNKEYDHKNNKALLDDVRSSLERKIYTLNDRLIQSEERWKDMNHLLIGREIPDQFEYSNESVQFSNFLDSNGITRNELLIDERLIFVLTPFHKDKFPEYDLVRSVCQRMGFKCMRGDENYFKGDIFPEMLRLIVKARVIIANVNGHNPNVMYELGIAQALDKPVILISRGPSNLPVDIKSQRFLIYDSTDQLEEQLKIEIDKIL